MNWSAFWTGAVAAIGGSAAVLGLLVFMGKKWIGTRIEQSVKSVYSKELESHKAKLQEQLHRAFQQMQSEYQDAVDQKATDKILFKTLLETLPSNGSIEFLRTFSMAGFSFYRSQLDQLKNLRLWVGHTRVRVPGPRG